MYNHEVKNKFIEYKEQMRDDLVSLKSILTQVSDLEKRENKDIANIPINIIGQYILGKTKITFTTFVSKIYQINEYREWALKMGYINKDEVAFVFGFNRKMLRAIYDEYGNADIFKTPTELNIVLNEFAPNLSPDRIHYNDIIRAYIELIYQGLLPDEVLNIKLSDIILTNCNIAIKTKNKTLIVYDEFYNDIKKIYTIRTFAKNVNQTNAQIIVSDRLIDNAKNMDNIKMHDSIIKAINNRRELNKSDDVSYSFKIKDIYIMGVIYSLCLVKNIDEYTEKDILRACYGGNKFTTKQRERVYTIINHWKI